MHRALLLTVSIVLLLSGCYTLLKHPRIADESTAARFAHDAEITPNDDCIRCHQEPQTYYNATLPYSSYYRSSSSAWLYYYDTPWWVEPYYYGGAAVQADSSVPSPRRFGRRSAGSDVPAGGQMGVSNPGAGSSGAVARAAKGGNSDQENIGKEEQKNRRSERRSTSTSKEQRRIRKKKQ